MYKLILLIIISFGTAYSSFAQDSEFVSQLTQKALPVDSALSFQNIFSSSQGKKLYKQLSAYQALGLGEASHGTHEYFIAKTKLIKQLLAANHYDLIALEAPYAEVEVLNQYILTNKGNLKEILKSFRQYTYETSEFAELINYLKEYNQTAKLKVLFYGGDFQSPFQVLQNLKTLAVSNAKANNAVDSLQNTVESSQKTVEALQNTIDSLQNIYANLNDALYAHMIDQQSYLNILKHSDVLNQGFKNTNNPAVQQNLKSYQQFLALNEPATTREGLEKASALRDSLMAQNILEEIKKGHRFLVWAHNGHVQKTPNSFSKTTGQHLLEQLKNDYAAIGFTTYAGYFTAYNNDENGVVRTNPLARPSESQIENDLKKLPYANYIVSTAGLSVPASVREYRFQVYGISENEFQKGNMFVDFDYIIFIANTTGSFNYYVKPK